MQFDRRDIDQIIKNFYARPNVDDYNAISHWYENNLQYQDPEYAICVYLFLIGANIRHRYRDFTYDQHSDWIKEIRDYIEGADSLLKVTRKTYLDYGNRAGI